MQVDSTNRESNRQIRSNKQKEAEEQEVKKHIKLLISY